jgi:hypothetical protein
MAITEIITKIFTETTKPILAGIVFLAHLAKGNVRQLLPSLIVRRLSSVNFSHFNFLL